MTIALIVINIAVFFATGMGSAESLADWGLTYGTGLHPVQWITHAFMHGDLEPDKMSEALAKSRDYLKQCYAKALKQAAAGS